MAKRTAAGNADREFLAGLPEFAGGDKPIEELGDATARSYANYARRALAADVPFSRKDARRHTLTPEHPGGAVPETPVHAYREGRPAPRVLGETPIIHKRPILAQPDVEFGAIGTPQAGHMMTVTNQRDAEKALRFARDLGPSEWERLVSLVVFDCSLGAYIEVFKHGHDRGFPARLLLERAREAGGLERYLINVISGRKSDATAQLNHICVYGITIMPPAV